MNAAFMERMEIIAKKLKELQEENRLLKSRLESATPIQTTPVGEEQDEQEHKLEYQQHEQQLENQQEEEDYDLPVTVYSDDYSLFSCCCRRR